MVADAQFDELTALLRSSFKPYRARDGIWTVLPDANAGQTYDGRARLYDALIGSRLYNAMMWGTSPERYAAFANEALQSSPGPMLDAGCGTLVSTASAYAQSDRLTVLVDLSLDMLEAGRARMQRLLGHVPDNLIFLQADLMCLPFKDHVFSSVLNPGVLHIVEDFETLARELLRITAPNGTVYCSSLVNERWLSGKYLMALHRAGEVAKPRTLKELHQRFQILAEKVPFSLTSQCDGAMAFLKLTHGS